MGLHRPTRRLICDEDIFHEYVQARSFTRLQKSGPRCTGNEYRHNFQRYKDIQERSDLSFHRPEVADIESLGFIYFHFWRRLRRRTWIKADFLDRQTHCHKKSEMLDFSCPRDSCRLSPRRYLTSSAPPPHQPLWHCSVCRACLHFFCLCSSAIQEITAQSCQEYHILLQHTLSSPGSFCLSACIVFICI